MHVAKFRYEGRYLYKCRNFKLFYPNKIISWYIAETQQIISKRWQSVLSRSRGQGQILGLFWNHHKLLISRNNLMLIALWLLFLSVSSAQAEDTLCVMKC